LKLCAVGKRDEFHLSNKFGWFRRRRSAPFIFVQSQENISGVAKPVKLAENPVVRLARRNYAGIMPDLIKAAIEKTVADQFGVPGEHVVHRMLRVS
jgi:hypothetical protein